MTQIRCVANPLVGGDSKPVKCLDAVVKRHTKNKPITLWPCHGQGGNQVKWGVIVCGCSLSLALSTE